MKHALHHLGLAAALVVCWLLTACSGHAPPTNDDPVTGDDQSLVAREYWPDATVCTPLQGDPIRGGELILALGETVLPAHAPVPATDAERTVFANLYETLTNVTCTGDLRPGLASSWTRQDGGRRWQLHLRDGAVFWDGTPVEAWHVVAAWQRNADLARDLGRPCPGLWIASGSRGLAVVDARTVEIRLAEPQDQLPRLLAHPSLAVALIQDGWLWPVGSGPCRLAADTDLPLPDLVCQPNRHHPEAPTWQQFRFRIQPGGDPRDLLVEGVDLALIRDRDAATYYDAVDGVHSAPLPWNRIYALLTPPDSDLDAGAAARAATGASPGAESRPWSRLDFHGCSGNGCPQLHGPTVGVLALPLDPDPAMVTLTRRRIYYLDGDGDARALVERAVAFGRVDLVPRAVDGLALAQALQEGDAAGYVVRLDACYPTACLTLAALLARADWLRRDLEDVTDACFAAGHLIDEDQALPLLQTRPRLVWRSPVAGLRLAHDGALLVARLGPAAAGAMP